jgi:hypothetical protein
LEDIGQEADLLERKLLLRQKILLCYVQALLCLLLLKSTDTQQCVDILCTHLLTKLTQTGDTLTQRTLQLCLLQLLLCSLTSKLLRLCKASSAKL